MLFLIVLTSGQRKKHHRIILIEIMFYILPRFTLLFKTFPSPFFLFLNISFSDSFIFKAENISLPLINHVSKLNLLRKRNLDFRKYTFCKGKKGKF